MPRFYVTFGSEGMMYRGGWAVIYAPNMALARETANEVFGLTEDGFGNWAFIYTDEDFKKTIMWKHGNHGNGCHVTLYCHVSEERSDDVE